MKKSIKLIILLQIILLVLLFTNIYEEIEEVNLLYKNKDTLVVTVNEDDIKSEKEFIDTFIQASEKYKISIYKYSKDEDGKRIAYTTNNEGFSRDIKLFYNNNEVVILPFEKLSSDEKITGKDLFYIDNANNIDNLVKDLKQSFNEDAITYVQGNVEDDSIFDIIFNNILYIIYCFILIFVNILLFIILINSDSKKIAILQSNGYKISNTVFTYFKPIFKWLSLNIVSILILAHICLFIKWETVKIYNLLIMILSIYYIVMIFILSFILFLMVQLQYRRNLNSRIKSRKTYNNLTVVLLALFKIIIALVIVIISKEMVELGKEYKEFKTNIEYFEYANSEHNSKDKDIYKLISTTPIYDTEGSSDTLNPLYKQAKKFIFDLEKKGLMLIYSDNYSLLSDNTYMYDTNAKLQGEDPRFSADGKNISVNKNYFQHNKIRDTFGERITAEDISEKENETTQILLVPEKYRNHEEEIKESYIESFKFYRYGIYDNKKFEELDEYTFDKFVANDINIKIIYLENNQEHFTYDILNYTDSYEKAYNYNILDPILVLVSDNLISRYYYNKIANQSYYMILPKGVDAYQYIYPEIKDNNYYGFVSIDEISDDYTPADNILGTFNDVAIISISFASIMITFITIAYYIVLIENNIKKMSIKKVHGYGHLSIFNRIILLDLFLTILICFLIYMYTKSLKFTVYIGIFNIISLMVSLITGKINLDIKAIKVIKEDI